MERCGFWFRAVVQIGAAAGKGFLGAPCGPEVWRCSGDVWSSAAPGSPEVSAPSPGSVRVQSGFR